VDSADVLDEEDTSCCTSGKQACSATGPDAPEGWRARVEGDGGVPAMPLPGRSLQACYHNFPRPPLQLPNPATVSLRAQHVTLNLPGGEGFTCKHLLPL